MSELNEQVTVTVDDTPAITVQTPLVDDFTAENAAPKASAVGAALALKADKDGIMEDVVININDETHSDNQGKILLYGDMIPTESGNNKPSVTGAIENVEGKLYGDQLPMSSVDQTKIATAIATVDAKTANEINYVAGTTIKTKVDAMDTTLGNALLKTAQSLSPEEKAQAQTNIGVSLVNNLTTSASGVGALDAYQGNQLNTAMTGLSGNFSSLLRKVSYTYEYSLGTSGNDVYKSVTAADLEMTPIEGYEPVAILTAMTGSTAVAVIRFNVSFSGSSVVTIRNLVTSDIRTGTLTVTVLFARTAAIATD